MVYFRYLIPLLLSLIPHLQMGNLSLPGVLHADIIDVRFPFSGQISSLTKKIGDHVSRGNLLATLDKKPLQNDLDRQLAEYESIRAQFEIFNLKNTANDDLTKYQRVGVQSQLNRSVKDVESAKSKLDQAELYSPVTGILVDDGNNRSGLFVTPASGAFRIIDTNSMVFRLEITPDRLPIFVEPLAVSIEIPLLKQNLIGTTSLPIPGPKDKFTINIAIGTPTDSMNFLPGIAGLAQITL